ncbi:Hypp9066 [Branchiostoma lanceolatum]|uniref:Hypp9066 protein n=1 Tax=Branchiostoma lanceolatum TaxID=7740 RepID=A0A8J9ZDL7_BRALA|nr:Hypp9066 [Branchiostoma lanceolatum]
MDFQSLPNFRAVVPGKLYRSAKVDNVTPDDVDKLSSLGIKTIVDLRTLNEYRGSSAPKLLDDTFQVVTLKAQDRKPHPPELHFTVKEAGSHQDKTHYFVTFVNGQFFKGVLQRKPWYLRIYIILTMILAWLVDTVLRTNGEYLRKVASPILASKDQGMFQLYKDYVDLSTGSMFAG